MHNNRPPPAYQLGPDGRRWHSWRILILPFIEGDSLYKRYRFDEPWDGPNNSQLADDKPSTFSFSRSDRPSATITNYLAIVGAETLWPDAASFRGQPKDGASQTILIAENYGLDVHWMEPRDLEFASMPFALQRPDGISSRYRTPAVAMADATIRSLKPDLDPRVVRAMATAAGGERLAESSEGWSIIEDGRDRELRE
jgi:hypothetical protein